jgi:hypothetical protein
MTIGADLDGDTVLDAPIAAWWAAVLAALPATPHPTHPRLRAKLDRTTLLLSGFVTTEDGHQEVVNEAYTYCGPTIESIDDHVAVAADNEGERGILSQTVFATFEDRDQAEHAAEALRHRSTLETNSLLVLAGPDRPGLDTVPEAYRARVVEALASGRAVLTATVDETALLALREVIDQDTSSIETVVAPPELTKPAPNDTSNRDSA